MRSRSALAALLLAPALLTGCTGGEGTPRSSGAVTAAGPPSAQTATVVAGPDLRFAPETVDAAVGTLTMTMRVEGGITHNLVPDDPSFASIGFVTTGSQSVTWTFTHPGTYRFQCTIHRGMVGQVVVR